MTMRHASRAGAAAGAAVMLLVLAACTGSGSSSPTTSSIAGGASGSATPSSAGSASGSATPPSDNQVPPDEYSAVPMPPEQIAAAIEQVDGIAQDVMSRSGIPGMAVAVVHGGKVVYAKGFGVREAGKPDPVDENTVFQLASVSKSIGSTVVAHAVGDGTVSWSDPVIKYLPDFQLADPAVTSMVTIGDLYAHRSGLPAQAGDDLEAIGFSRDEIIARLRLFPLNPFRVTYGYSNFGMTTGGEAVARAAGTTWEDLSARELYEPLGMTSTSSRYADFLARTNRATLHFNQDGSYQPLYIRNADAQSPAGGVSSSVTDMAKWLTMNLAGGMVDGQQLIDADALQQAHNPQITSNPATTPDARSRFYGFGFNIETTSSGVVKWGHSGAFSVGAGTTFAMLPAADVGIVVLTNASPVGAAEAVATTFTDLVRTGTVQRDWLGYFGPIFGSLYVNHSPVAAPPPATPAPARPVADYVGTYTNDYAGDVVVSASGDELTLQVGPKGLNAPLAHYDGDVFSWLAPGGNGEPVTAVTFGGDAGGPAQTVQIEILNARGLGTFTRTS